MQARQALWIALGSAALGVPVGVGLARSAHAPAAAPERAAPPLALGPRGLLGVPASGAPAPPGPHAQVQGLAVAPASGSVLLGWEVLRAFETTPARGLAGLPAAIRALDGTRVTMAGYLLPELEWEDIRAFSLVASPWSCHFGDVAGLSGTVHVALAAGQPGLANTLQPLRVVGTFRVGEVRESGWLLAIYSLEDASAALLR